MRSSLVIRACFSNSPPKGMRLSQGKKKSPENLLQSTTIVQERSWLTPVSVGTVGELGRQNGLGNLLVAAECELHQRVSLLPPRLQPSLRGGSSKKKIQIIVLLRISQSSGRPACLVELLKEASHLQQRLEVSRHQVPFKRERQVAARVRRARLLDMSDEL
jgi:hypothetical protein